MSYESLHGKAHVLRGPKWSQIEERVRSLDALNLGSVFLKAANESVLSIGGDHKNGFVVFISREDQHRYLVAPPDERKGTVRLIVGFQPGDYPRRIVVSLGPALQAANTFFNKGQADEETAEWTSDSKTIER
jgi:hypothetical protein